MRFVAGGVWCEGGWFLASPWVMDLRGRRRKEANLELRGKTMADRIDEKRCISIIEHKLKKKDRKLTESHPDYETLPTFNERTTLKVFLM